MQSDSLARLVEVSKALSTYTNLDELSQVIVNAAAELTGSTGVSLLLFDETDRVLRYVATTWCPQDFLTRSALEDLAVPPRSSVAGWVMDGNRPVSAQLKGKDPLVFDKVEALMPVQVRTIAAVPLAYRKLPIGVLESYNSPGGRFSETDVEILEMLASLASVSIYNAHLLHRAKEAYAELAELDQMKSDFIAITSHELRTPLGVIIGHTAVLQEIADAEIGEQLGVIARNASRLQEIPENLSAINRLNADEMRGHAVPADLNDIVLSCVAQHAEQASAKNIRLRAEVTEKDLHVLADPDILSIVLNNLLRNALVFSESSRQGRVLVSLQQKGGLAIVSVIDNGVGIPEKDLERVFDRFFQVEDHLRRRHGGMGVGLSSTKVLVEMFGGEIWVESVEGEGSKFSFSLSLIETKSSALQED